MSAWRRKALEFLPQFRIEIDKSNSVTYLWVMISGEFTSAVGRSDQAFIDGTLKYLIWSLSEESGDESKQAVCCGFLEDIASNKKFWKYFSNWFTRKQFEQYKDSFLYALSDKQFEELENEFYGK